MYELPSLIGHRGVAAHAPENTLAALRKAAEFGLRMVEFDVKLTADKRPILFHDDTLDRTTDGRGRVKDATLDEIGHLDAGITFGRDFIGEPVPTLEEAVDLLGVLGMRANIEIKPCPGTDRETARIALQAARAMWPSDLPPPLISGFSAIAMKAAVEAAPDWPRALLVETLPTDWRDKARAIDAVCVNVGHKGLTSRAVEEIKAAGLAVAAWTVNDPARAAALLDWGVDALFTDSPPALAGIGILTD